MKSRVLIVFIVCALLIGQFGTQDVEKDQDLKKQNASVKDPKNQSLKDSNILNCYKCSSKASDESSCYKITELVNKTSRKRCNYCSIEKTLSPDNQVIAVKRGCNFAVTKSEQELDTWLPSSNGLIFFCNNASFCNSVDVYPHERLSFKAALTSETGVSIVPQDGPASRTDTSAKPVLSESSTPSAKPVPPVPETTPTEAPKRFFVIRIYESCCSNNKWGLALIVLVAFLFFMLCCVLPLLFLSFSSSASSVDDSQGDEVQIIRVRGVESKKNKRSKRKAKAIRSRTRDSDSIPSSIA